MAKNKTYGLPQSSGKEHRDGKNFRIPISNGIFEHYGRLKDARWLLDLFVDWTTKEVRAPDGSLDGIVLGGKPIRDEDIVRAFGGQISDTTARRWRRRLARFRYIMQKRTPMGHVIRVKKSKKWVHQPTQDGRVIGQKWPVRSVKNDRSELSIVTGQIGHNRTLRTADHDRSNKDYAVQNRDIAVEEAASAAFSFLKSKNERAFRKIIFAFQGEPRLLEIWTDLYSNKQDDEILSETMERFILKCKARGIRLAGPFFDVKRTVEKYESDEVDSPGSLPVFVDPAGEID